MASFIWDRLIPADWDQSLLTSVCPHCDHGTRRITYDFPREDKVTRRVAHIVGIASDDFVPMMWETYPTDDPSDLAFSFNYQIRRSPWGLNKAGVFSREALRRIFALYREKASAADFP